MRRLLNTYPGIDVLVSQNDDMTLARWKQFSQQEERPEQVEISQ